MKHYLFLVGISIIVIFSLPVNTPPGYTQVQISVPGNITDTLDIQFEKIVNTLRRRNTENISLLGARKYKFGYRRALISLDSLKKSGRYQELYDSLSTYFSLSPSSFVYYDEIIRAGSASGNLLLLKNRLDNIRPILISDYELYARAVILNLRGNVDSSISIIKDVFQRHSANSTILLQYANSLREKGRYGEVLELIKAHFKPNDSESYISADILILKGNISFVQGKYEEAENFYSKAAAIASPAYDLYAVAKAKINTGLVFDMYGNVDGARSLMEEGIRLAEEIKEPDLIAYGYSELGVSWSFTADYIEALANYNNSIRLYSKLGNEIRLAYLYSNKGNIQNILGNYGGAISTYGLGLESAGDATRAIIQNLTGMADSYNNLANYTKSIQLYSEAAQLAEKINDVDLLAHIEYGIGSFKFNIGAYPAAMLNYNKALQLAESVNNQNLSAEINDKLALVHSALGERDTAVTILDGVLKESKRQNDRYLQVLASLHLIEILKDGKEYSTAISHLNRIRPALTTPGYENLLAEAMLLETEIYKLSVQFEKALQHLKMAEPLILSGTNFQFRMAYYSLAAQIENAMNNPAAAAQNYTLAIHEYKKAATSLTERNGNLTSLAVLHGQIFEDAIDAHIKVGDYTTAFELTEQMAGRISYKNVSSMILGEIVKSHPLLDTLYALDWSIHSGYYTKTEVDSMSAMFESLASGAGIPSAFHTKTLTLFEIQRKLSDDEFLYTIRMTEDSTFIFLVSAVELQVIKRKGGKTSLNRIKKAISPQYDNRVGTPDFVNKDLFAFDVLAAKYLYNFLFGDVAEKIAPGSKIIVIPDEFLKNFPLEILVSNTKENTGSFNYEECEFAGDNYRFIYTPGYSVYNSLSEKQKNSSKNTLLVGNPYMSTGSKLFSERRGLMKDSPTSKASVMLPLRYSMSEVENINNMLDFATVLSGSFATESRFKELAADASLIHLSTHSALFREQPLIFFSNLYDVQNDGFLEAGEIASLNLHADLVVLSSCGSGLGSSAANEGVVGFNKALLEGGAKSVLSTLWEIDDKYTAVFMSLFYHQLSVGVSKSEALRRAKSEFIRTIDPNPYYWGAFVLYGSDASMHIEKKNYIFIIMQYVSLAFLFSFILLIYLRRLTRKKVRPL